VSESALEIAGGWRLDLEDHGYLTAHETGVWRDRVYGLFRAPEELNRRWLRTEHQGPQGSCQGHALSDVGEVCYHVATQGEVIQFSRQYCYIRSQYYDGIKGDQGSTLTAGAKVAMQDGFPPEELWPYSGRYETRPPNRTWDDILLAAAAFKLRTVERLRSYDDIFAWLAGGIGAVWIGIRWGGGGGHSVSIPGYTRRKDSRGRNYLDMHNSWGPNWGNGGWKEIEPAQVDRWFRDPYTVVLGGSDMYGDGIAPRPVDWAKESPYVDRE